MPTPKGTIVVTAAQLPEGFLRQRRRGEVHRGRYGVLEDLGDGTYQVRKPPANSGVIFPPATGAPSTDRFMRPRSSSTWMPG